MLQVNDFMNILTKCAIMGAGFFIAYITIVYIISSLIRYKDGKTRAKYYDKLDNGEGVCIIEFHEQLKRETCIWAYKHDAMIKENKETFIKVCVGLSHLGYVRMSLIDLGRNMVSTLKRYHHGEELESVMNAWGLYYNDMCQLPESIKNQKIVPMDIMHTLRRSIDLVEYH